MPLPVTAGQRRADAKAIALGGVIALSGTELLPQGAPIASFVNRQVGSPFTLPAFSMMTQPAGDPVDKNRSLLRELQLFKFRAVAH